MKYWPGCTSDKSWMARFVAAVKQHKADTCPECWLLSCEARSVGCQCAFGRAAILEAPLSQETK